ncbi:YceI family protein [Roseomonas sp. 18066]|uniref:YceI family protein n=1 Tax=Roseomonas sp. 18066 TaxID=2681412 RepID=UPI0013596013|nr:YceI family protein [Roseomonas sp. 18066]
MIRDATRRLALASLLLPLLPLLPGRARAGSVYDFDQRHGRVNFSVGVLGMFDVKGSFDRFMGRLDLDLAQPERSSVSVEFQTASVSLPAPDQIELLRSAAYLDAPRHPVGRFSSTAITALSPTRYRLDGVVELRGTRQPLQFDAELRDRHVDAARGIEVADLVLTGAVMRSAFGMVADRPLLSDTVQLSILMHLEVPHAP